MDGALAGLLDLDVALRARFGGSDLRRRAAVSLWIAERRGARPAAADPPHRPALTPPVPRSSVPGSGYRRSDFARR